MWAITSSSEMCPIGLKRAIAITARPEPKQTWRQVGTGPLVPAQDHHPVPVEDAGEGDRDHLDRDECTGDVGEGRDHGNQRSDAVSHPMPASLVASRDVSVLDSRFPPIGSYGFLSDCHTGALVSYDGAVEWLCLPRFDSPSIFGSLLDRGAGHFKLGPRGVVVPISRRYEPGTLIDRDDLGHRHRLGRHPRRADDRRLGRTGTRKAAADRTRGRPLAAAGS